MMRTTITLVLVSGSILGCSSALESDWERIDELDGRLGTVTTIDAEGALVERPRTDPPSDSNQAIQRVESLVSLMATGTPRDIALVEVRRSTIENNLRIQSALIAPEVAAQSLRAEQAKFQSTFTASVQQRRVVSPQYYGELFDVETDSFTAVPGLEVPLRTGGSVQLDWTVATSNNTNGLSGQADGFAATRPGVSLQQPLLQGGGIEYNEASIVLAGARLGSARAEAQVAVINQVVRAEIAYWQLHLAWRQLEIDLQLYKTSRDLLEQQRRLVDAGAGSIANVYNFETAVAASVEQVIQSEDQLRRTVRAVKVVMQEPGMSLDGSVALRPSSEPKLVGYDFDQQMLVRTALRNRAELLQLEFQQLARSVTVMLRENEMLPQLDLQAAWNANGFASGLSIERANSDLGNEPDGWAVGLQARVSLGNDAAIANYEAAILQRLQTVADRRQQEILVTQEVLDAIDSLEAGWNSILTAELQVQAATRFYAAYETLFNRGQIPSSNLTQALRSLNAAKTQQAAAEVSYQIALANLAQASGCLLGHASVDWEDDLDLERLERPESTDPLVGIPSGVSDPLDTGGGSLETLEAATSSSADGGASSAGDDASRAP